MRGSRYTKDLKKAADKAAYELAMAETRAHRPVMVVDRTTAADKASRRLVLDVFFGEAGEA